MIINIAERLQKVFREVFDDDKIVIFDQMISKDIEDWDSLMHINLIISIEEEFRLKFTTDEILGMENVGEFIRLIEKKIM